MKTKKALKLIKEILVLANELQLKQNVMKAVCAPIPEYKKRTSFSEAFEKAKNEYSVLKKSYDEIEKSMPFAHPLSEESIWQKKGFINVSVDGVHAKYNKRENIITILDIPDWLNSEYKGNGVYEFTMKK